jgi:serine/threonine protein kinase
MKATKGLGRWKINESFGGGGQADVYIVYDVTGERPGTFALKKLKNPKRGERFSREIAGLKKLQGHPNIVKIVDSDPSESPSWFVMELGDGSLESLAPADGYEREHAFEVFRQICQGVQALHDRGIIHRDLKPENIIVSAGRALVGDLGLCLIEELVRLTPDWEAIGARYYMAPEAEAGRDDDADARTDIYSLGKILYWLLNQSILPREKLRHPKYALPSRKQHEALDEFVPLIEDAIAENRSVRIRNVVELQKQFEQAVNRYRQRPETTLATKLQKNAGVAASELLDQLTPDERVRVAEQVLTGTIKLDQQETWKLILALPACSEDVELSLLALLPTTDLERLIPAAVSRYFSSEEAARSFGAAFVNRLTDVRPRIVEFLIESGTSDQIHVAARTLGLTTMEAKPDLGRILARLGPPEDWSLDLIASAHWQSYDGRADHMRAIMATAGDDIERFSAAAAILANDEDWSGERLYEEISNYLKEHMDSETVQKQLAQLQADDEE